MEINQVLSARLAFVEITISPPPICPHRRPSMSEVLDTLIVFLFLGFVVWMMLKDDGK